LLFDLLDRITPNDAFAAPPGTSVTPLDTADGHSQDGQVLVSQGLWDAFPPGPGPKPVHAAPAAASADQIGQPDTPTFELTIDGALLDAQPSADGELESIVSPLRQVVRFPLPDEPRAEDHVCTPADFVVGPVARFEANLAALALVKTLAAEGRPAAGIFVESRVRTAVRLSERQRCGMAQSPLRHAIASVTTWRLTNDCPIALCAAAIWTPSRAAWTVRQPTCRSSLAARRLDLVHPSWETTAALHDESSQSEPCYDMPRRP
jgi:hypothetical protein